MKPVRVGIAGAGGRMGQKLIEAVLKSNFSVVLTAAVDRAKHPQLGMQAAMLCGKAESENKVKLTDSFNPSDVDVFIDFSTPAAAVELSQQCRQHKIAMVVGVTGFSKIEKKELDTAAKSIPLLISPNMSFGILAMYRAMKQIAALLNSYHSEICEAHHEHKKDAPSGTALQLGKIIAKTRGDDFDDVAIFNRQRRENKRGKNEIGFSAIRGGDIVGEHRVIFASNGEQLEVIHRSTDRINYAHGAVAAAWWLSDQPQGLYDMEDVVD